jgi:hypothetical protein
MTRPAELSEAMPTFSYADQTLPGVCPQKHMLVADYRARIRSFVAAVEAWEHTRESFGTDSCLESFTKTEATRLSCEKARVALRVHVREHGCS